MSVCLCLFVCLSVCLCVCVSACLFASLLDCLFICFGLFVCLCLVCLSACLSLDLTLTGHAGAFCGTNGNDTPCTRFLKHPPPKRKISKGGLCAARSLEQPLADAMPSCQLLVPASSLTFTGHAGAFCGTNGNDTPCTSFLKHRPSPNTPKHT